MRSPVLPVAVALAALALGACSSVGAASMGRAGDVAAREPVTSERAPGQDVLLAPHVPPKPN